MHRPGNLIFSRRLRRVPAPSRCVKSRGKSEQLKERRLLIADGTRGPFYPGSGLCIPKRVNDVEEQLGRFAVKARTCRINRGRTRNFAQVVEIPQRRERERERGWRTDGNGSRCPPPPPLSPSCPQQSPAVSRGFKQNRVSFRDLSGSYGLQNLRNSVPGEIDKGTSKIPPRGNIPDIRKKKKKREGKGLALVHARVGNQNP